MAGRLVANLTFCPGNLGKGYNEFMELLPDDDDWAVLMDNDVMFTTDRWWYQLKHAIEKDPKAGMFTAMTNRLGSPEQVYECRKHREKHHLVFYCSKENHHDMVKHKEIGHCLMEQYGSDVVKMKGFSRGMLMCISKATWKKVGGFPNGIGGVDMVFLRKLKSNNLPVYILKGLYVYHWYRQHFFSETEFEDHWSMSESKAQRSKNLKRFYGKD